MKSYFSFKLKPHVSINYASNPYPTATSVTSRCLAERRDPSVAVQNTYSSLKGMETQDTTTELTLLVC